MISTVVIRVREAIGERLSSLGTYFCRLSRGLCWHLVVIQVDVPIQRWWRQEQVARYIGGGILTKIDFSVPCSSLLGRVSEDENHLTLMNLFSQ